MINYMDKQENSNSEENFIPTEGIFNLKCSCCGKIFSTNNICQDICNDCLAEYNSFLDSPSFNDMEL